MRPLYLLLALFFLQACSGEEKPEVKIPPQKAVLVEDLSRMGNMAAILQAHHERHAHIQGDFRSFQALLDGLSREKVSSVVIATDYAMTCIPAKAACMDSVYILLHGLHDEVMEALQSGSIDYDAELPWELLQGPRSYRAEAFEGNLRLAGIRIMESEGNIYFTEIPGHFHERFMGRVSGGTEWYLHLQKVEKERPFADDGSLLISWEEVYGRALDWDDFLKDHPGSIFSDHAADRRRAYLDLFCSGIDNTPIFDYHDGRLLPEVKVLYERIIQEGEPSYCRDIIEKYYRFLVPRGFHQSEDVYRFLDQLLPALASEF